METSARGFICDLGLASQLRMNIITYRPHGGKQRAWDQPAAASRIDPRLDVYASQSFIPLGGRFCAGFYF
jgi:hypothetical protein